MQKNNKTEALIELLRSAGDKGVALQVAMDTLKSTKTAIYSAIHGIRKLGHNVPSESGVYFYKGHSDSPQLVRSRKNGKAKASPQTPVEPMGDGKVSNVTFDIPRMLANKNLINDLKKLSDSDRRDFLDMAKKAVFYWKSAMNIIQAQKSMNEMALELGVSLED